MICALCNKEAAGNLNPETDYVICFGCTTKLFNTNQHKLKLTQSALVEKGFKEKADIITAWIVEEVENAEKTDGEASGSMDRKRTHRQVRASI